MRHRSLSRGRVQTSVPTPAPPLRPAPAAAQTPPASAEIPALDIVSLPALLSRKPEAPCAGSHDRRRRPARRDFFGCAPASAAPPAFALPPLGPRTSPPAKIAPAAAPQRPPET